MRSPNGIDGHPEWRCIGAAFFAQTAAMDGVLFQNAISNLARNERTYDATDCPKKWWAAGFYPASRNCKEPYVSSICVRQKWRRRESNPGDDRHSALENKRSSASQEGLAADWQRLSCHFGNMSERDLQVVRELHFLHLLWPQLPAEFRIQFLIDMGRVRLTADSV
jgi:hypothetical protein